MPELPEVQTVVTQLGKKVVGKTIARFWSDWQKKILTPFSTFTRLTKGATIVGTRRLGKHVIIDLAHGYSIVAHLKMTGHFLVKDDQTRQSKAFTEDRVNGYIHHIFTFTDGATLEFSDMRKFGWLKLMKTDEVETLPSIASLGIDALSSKLNQKMFDELLLPRAKRSIGEVLLEQQRIAGIGNIYRSEALFLARVLPMRRISTLSPDEKKKILPAIKHVLRQAVKLRGTSDGDFRDTDGLEGRFQRTLYVYGRTKEPCKKCGTMIERIVLGSRSVFFCPRCQQ